jgi:sugar (pentulose or hexulose) kinase
MGSAEATFLVTRAPALADELRRSGFSSGCHALDGAWYVGGGLQASGALVEWFIDRFLGAGVVGAAAASAGVATAPAPRTATPPSSRFSTAPVRARPGRSFGRICEAEPLPIATHRPRWKWRA